MDCMRRARRTQSKGEAASGYKPNATGRMLRLVAVRPSQFVSSAEVLPMNRSGGVTPMNQSSPAPP
jgi:hypothetical protein